MQCCELWPNTCKILCLSSHCSRHWVRKATWLCDTNTGHFWFCWSLKSDIIFCVSISLSNLRDCNQSHNSNWPTVLAIHLRVALMKYCKSPFMNLFYFLLWEFFCFSHIYRDPYNFLTGIIWMTPYLMCLSALHSLAIQRQTMQSAENRSVEVTFA